MAKLADRDLISIIASEIAAADILYAGEVATQQAKAMEYYLAEPFGNEVRGRSSVVMSEVSDVVESILPSLLRIFTAGDHIAQFFPTGVEDEQSAKQRTDYANYVFMRDNPGFSILHSWFKDALISKVGVVKLWWDPTQNVSRETYENLDDLQFQMLLSDQDVTVTAHSERPESSPLDQNGAPPSFVHDVTVKRVKSQGRIHIANVPPEEFLISREATRIDDARSVHHRTHMTEGELLSQGFDADLVNRLPTWATEFGIQRTARFSNDASRTTADESSWNGADRSMRPVAIVDSYLWVDRDGDGEAEFLRVITGGQDGGAILLEEDWPSERAPFYSLCPLPLPHRFYGLSLADLVMDLQLIKSTIIRQILDNLYVANNGRTAVDINRIIDLDDVLISRPNQVIRTLGSAGDVVFPIPHTPVPSHSFGMIEYLDSVRETRTGITRYNQGLHADSLNKTASGISQIMAASQQRIELIARIFAETGVRELFEGIDELAMRYQDRERTIRLRNEWIAVDPRDWKGKMDASVQVGLGTSNKTEMQASIAALMAVQEKLIATGKGYMVSDQNIHGAVMKFAEVAGLKPIELFFTEPPEQPPEPPPSPQMQVEMAKLEIEKQRMQLETQEKQANIQLRTEETRAKIALERMKVEAQIALDRVKVQADIENDRHKMLASVAMKAQNGGENARTGS